MDVFESRRSVEESAALVKARIAKRQKLQPAVSRARALSVSVEPSPTKELDALVLANALVGYGANMSLENMAIIENVIKFSKLEATYEVPDGNPEAWYLAFLQCMDEVGCFVVDAGYTAYMKSSFQLTMDNIVTDIIKAGVDAAKAAIPGVSVLGAIADSTLESLKKEPEAINLFNSEVIKSKGVRLAIMPCEQLANGIIVTSLTSIDSVGGSNDGGIIFFDWKTSGREVSQGSSFITFNPLRYAEHKDNLEEYLGQHYKSLLSKRFQRRKSAMV